MDQVIIYQNEAGGVAVCMPTAEALGVWGIEAIALKDVPAGRPFKIVNVADLPPDGPFFNAWEVDGALLTDGVGAESNEFPKRAEEPPAVLETPFVPEPPAATDETGLFL
jgi:hypothetical protein